MDIVYRLIRVALAFIIALIVGTLAFFMLSPLAGDAIMAGVTRLMEALSATDDPGAVLDYTAHSISRLLFLLIVAPITLTGLIGEVSKWRSPLWYIAGTALLTVAVPVLAISRYARSPTPEEMRILALLGVVGAITGLVYWLIAGNNGGRQPMNAEAQRRIGADRP